MAKVLITIPDEFLNKVDGFVNQQNKSRSEIIREALKTYMRKASAKQLQHASEHAEILEDILS